jgi:hypothetical protein
MAAGKFVGKGAKAAGKYLTEQTPLRNANKLNPFALTDDMLFNKEGVVNRQLFGDEAFESFKQYGPTTRPGVPEIAQMMEFIKAPRSQVRSATGEVFDVAKTMEDGAFKYPYFQEGNLWYTGKQRSNLAKEIGKERIITTPKDIWFAPAGEGTVMSGDDLISKGLIDSYSKGRRVLMPGSEYANPSKYSVFEPHWWKGYKQLQEDGGQILNEYPMMQDGGTTDYPIVDDAGNFNEEGVWIPNWEAMTAQAKKLGSKTVRTKNGSIIYFDNNWNVKGVDENPIMQFGGGAPTMADSLALYKNSKKVVDYYNDKKYKNYSNINYKKKENYKLYNKDALIGFLGLNKSTGIRVPSDTGLKYETKSIPVDSYHKKLDANRYLQRENQFGALDTKAPMQLFDNRITPTMQYYYVNEKVDDPLYNDTVSIYSYDPILVKPVSMLTSKERAIRLKRYGKASGLIDKKAEPSTSTEKLKTELEKVKPPVIKKSEETKPAPYTPTGSKKYIVNGIEVSEDDFLGTGNTTGGSKRIIYSTPKLETQKVLRLDGTPETDPEKISRALSSSNNVSLMQFGGGLLSQTVSCSNCGHSWKAADGGYDPMTCHKCGGVVKMKGGGYVVTRSNDRKGKTHKVTGPDGTVKYFGDSKLGQHPKDPERKAAFYARHKKNLDNNPFFRAFARKTWQDGGSTPEVIMPRSLEQLMNPNRRGVANFNVGYNNKSFSTNYGYSGPDNFKNGTHSLNFSLPSFMKTGSLDGSAVYSPGRSYSANLTGMAPANFIKKGATMNFSGGYQKDINPMMKNTAAPSYNMSAGFRIPTKAGNFTINASYRK